jgi:hypothetical protein
MGNSMARHLRKALLLGLLVCGISASLSGCAPRRNPFARESPTNRWMAAMLAGDYAAAEGLLRGSNVSAWRTETDQLGQQHGKVRAIWRDDVAGYQNEAPFTSIRVVWADGLERCLRVRRTADEYPELLDGGWQDCATVPFNSTPPPP